MSTGFCSSSTRTHQHVWFLKPISGKESCTHLVLVIFGYQTSLLKHLIHLFIWPRQSLHNVMVLSPCLQVHESCFFRGCKDIVADWLISNPPYLPAPDDGILMVRILHWSACTCRCSTCIMHRLLNCGDIQKRSREICPTEIFPVKEGNWFFKC
jgi:hypothetical protein